MAAYQVTLVTSDQIPNPTGDLQDVYDITFTIGSQPGTFTVQVPLNTTDVVAAAAAAIDEVASQVNGIYGL